MCLEVQTTFINNSVFDKGGAVYVYPGLKSIYFVESAWNTLSLLDCFITPEMDNSEDTGYIYFENNLAENGGDEIYGASLSGCPLIAKHTDGISAVSSDPLRVCICDSNDKPQCSVSCGYDVFAFEAYPGENLTISAAIVGADYGTTIGVLYTTLYRGENSPNTKLISNAQNGLVIHNSKRCANISLSLLSDHTPQTVMLSISTVYASSPFSLRYSTSMKYFDGTYCYSLETMSIAYNITLLACPPGFTLVNQCCDCFLHHTLFDTCKIANGTGYISRGNQMLG